jgi:hypothetical protein
MLAAMQFRSHVPEGDTMSRRSLERRERRWTLFATAAVVSLVAAVAVGPGARAGEGAPTAPYSVALTALTGPAGADLALELGRAPAAPAVDTLKKVQLKLFAADGALASVRNLKDVPAPGGRAQIDLGQVERGRRVEAHVSIQDDRTYARTDGRTYVVRAETLTRLRPDLVVAELHAPPQTTTSRAIDVVAEIAELNGDTAATATATLMLGPSPLAPPQQLAIEPGGRVSVTFAGVALPNDAQAELSVFVGSAAPYETDDANNARTRSVDVSRHELVPSNVLVPSLGGYGAQFNHHVYAPITNLPASSFADLESAVLAFEPQFVRIFYNENWAEPGQPRYHPENIESFRRTVALAQAAGATINVTYQTVSEARSAPGPHMQRFAAVLEDLVENRSLTNVRWVTVANEPNSTQMTLPQFEALNRALHAELVARGVRDHIRIMGGDLVENAGERDHAIWFEFMASKLGDIVDAYSEHIFWWYDTFRLEGTRRFEFRLRDIRKLVVEDNLPERRRPTYITEFGVRGLNTAPGKPTHQDAYHADGTELRRTNVAAFQQLWFAIASAQLGFTGASKWDLYWGKYDLTNPPNQSYWMINPTEDGWEVFPTYHALRLLLQTTQRGWQVVRLEPWVPDDWDPLLPDEPEQELAAYAGEGGALTIVGLDTNGRLLNAASAETSSYSIGGLPPSTTFNLGVWNATGTGENSIAGTVTTSAAGVARFSVPLHAAFALTTVS